jgi:uncharacterized protein YbjT (DUF2867 family)
MLLMKAMVIGATGLVGQQLTQILCEDPTVESIQLLTRRNWPVVSHKVHLHEIQFHQDWWQKYSCPPCHVAFCCLGTTMKVAGTKAAFELVDFKLVKEFALFAKKSGVNHFILISAMGADPRSHFFYNRIKGQAERAIGQMGFTQLSIVRPSLLLGRVSSQRTDELFAEIVLKTLKPLLIGPLRAVRAIEARDVARAMRHISRYPQSGCTIYKNDQLQDFADRERTHMS